MRSKKSPIKYETIVLIPTHNQPDLLTTCLESLSNQKYRNFKVVVIDNNSSKKIREKIGRKFPNIEILNRPTNDGFTKSVNDGIKFVIDRYQPAFTAVLNDDTKANSDWLDSLVGKIKSDNQIAAVAANMFFADHPDIINSQGCALNGRGLGIDINFGKSAKMVKSHQLEVLAASFGAALIRTKYLKSIGLLDELFYAYMEDLDWGWRANLFGYKVVFEPSAKVYHKFSASWQFDQRKKIYLGVRNSLRCLIKNAGRKMLISKLTAIFFLSPVVKLWGIIFKTRDYELPIIQPNSLDYVLALGKAVGWNLYYLPDTLRQRKVIQQKRQVSDTIIRRLLVG